MALDRKTPIDRARDLVTRKLRPYSVKIYLFGSFARGTESHSSDIDVAIESEDPLPPGVLARLREDLEESDIPRRVEIVDLRDTDPAFRARVRKEGIRLKLAERALATFQELAALEEPGDVERDAAIQRFEYTFEAAWKAAQRYLNLVEGIDAGSPKGCMRASRDVGLLDEGMTERALRMADDRNPTVHMYNEALAAAVYARLSDHAETLRSWLGAVRKGLAAS